MQNPTTLIIAHRLLTVQHTTRISVLDEGQILQSGSHDVLIAEDGVYKQLGDLQFRELERDLAGVLPE